MKKWLKKLFKFNAVLVCLGLILGSTSFSPTVSAKTNYKTLAFDKKLEKKQDFENGQFKNSKIKETADGIEIGSLDSQSGEYVTPVVQAPFGATHIGLHWREDLIDGNLLIAFIRTSNDGINFGDWIQTTVETDEGKDGKKNEEIFAALIGAEKNSFAQAKIEFISQNGISPKLKSLTFTFINSGDESKQVTNELSFAPKSIAAGVGTLKTSPNGQSVNVISREDWGADESYRLNADGSESWPRSYHGTRKLVVHHTAVASSNGVTDLETNKAEVRAIYYYHAVTQTWGDIGYNALVDAAGNVYEGRYGTHDGITRTAPTADQIMALDVEAGHTSGYNSGSFGVAALGDFTNYNIPLAQLAGVENVLAYVADSRGIDALGNSDFRRYDGTWHIGLNNIIGHRDATATACPGNNFYPLIGNIKTSVASLMRQNLTGFSATTNAVSISGKSVGLGLLNFSWGAFPNATQYQYVLERVFGVAGVASNSEPWQTAWFYPENTNVQTTANTSVQIDASTLQANSNYVFYVRALDANGVPISAVSQVNFLKDSSVPVIDTIAPAVAINNPTDGTTVNGIVAIGASATDAVGVARVDFYVNGQLIGSDSSSPYSFNWDSKMVADGAVLILAKAFDATGNVGVSNTINVTVNNAVVTDTTAPIVIIKSPVNGANVKSGTVSISASATDNINVVSMKLYIDGSQKATSLLGGLNYSWNTRKVSVGQHTIKVQAYDEAGNIGETSIIVNRVK